MHSLQFLTMAIPVFKEQVLALKPKLLLLALAVACDNIMALKEVNPVSDLLWALQGQENITSIVSSIMMNDSLKNLTERCYTSDKNLAIHDFIYMISTIHIRVAVIRQVYCIFSEHFYSTLDQRDV